jgi:2-keto-4-pentenoate hydratase/2-oxohepta-3-ene-1,7-dioic acid hydratase in catechol pathway
VHLVSYTSAADGPRVGVEVEGAVHPTAYRDMVDFIVDGEVALDRARDAVDQGRAESNVRLLAPLPRPGKMLFLGRSFREFRPGLDDDVEPFVYSRVPSSVVGPGETISVPEADATLLYEGELLIVVGRPIKRADAGEAMDAVFGYTQVNDVTWTNWLESPHGGPPQICLCKNADTFCPMGPYIATADSFDPGDVAFSVTVNGEQVMRASTSGLVWGVGRVLEFLSRSMTLLPGDVIATGTPAAGPIVAGDSVTVSFDGLGELTNPVAAGW